MKIITQEQFKKAYNLHQLYLDGDESGVCLAFNNCDLRDIDFTDMKNLSDSNLRNSDLSDSNLRNSDLSDSNLRNSDLSGSDLRGSNLRGSNLRGSDLRGSDLDFSCWGLSCRTLKVNIDKRIARQLLYHALAVAMPHMPKRAINKTLLDFANGFHRVGEVPVLKKENV